MGAVVAVKGYAEHKPCEVRRSFVLTAARGFSRVLFLHLCRADLFAILFLLLFLLLLYRWGCTEDLGNPHVLRRQGPLSGVVTQRGCLQDRPSLSGGVLDRQTLRFWLGLTPPLLLFTPFSLGKRYETESGGFVVSAFGIATRSADWPGYVG